MITLDNSHTFVIQEYHSIDTCANARLAENAFVIVKECHLRNWISPHSIDRTDIDTRSSFTRTTDIGNINTNIIIFDNLEPRQARLEFAFVFCGAGQFTHSTPGAFGEVNRQL
jgi:hypothetical protein